MTNLLRSAEETNRFLLALAPIDQAFTASEQKWGVGRLERLVGTNTLTAYQRGWDAYRLALEEGDGPSLEIIGPKMTAALAFMDAEAAGAGHQPLDPCSWEAPLPDGRVLVVVRTNAEATAIMRAEKIASAETTLPPDLAVTIRTQHQGRALIVVTMAEVARLMLTMEAKVLGTPWEGAPAHSGVQRDEGDAADVARRGYPLEALPTAQSAPKPALAF